MKIATISDVHIKQDNDQYFKVLEKMATHPEFKSVNTLVLLGDIFDVLIGPHQNYFIQYKSFFELLAMIAKEKKVYYLTGNHDFHLEKLFANFKIKYGAEIHYLETQLILDDEGKSILFQHGDDVEIDNGHYGTYKKIITSKTLKFSANYLIPLWLLNLVAAVASRLSNGRDRQKYQQTNFVNMIREKFRKSAELYHQKHKFDLLVCGHSHVKDHFEHKDFTYLNNGHAYTEQTFLIIENGKPRFIHITHQG